MEIIKLNVDDVIPYEGNAKEHPQEQIEQIKNSILQFGDNDPIAIDENNVIIEGHGRFIALKELGYTEIDCIRLSHLSEEDKNAYRLVHNQLTMNSGWDLDILKKELSKINLDMSTFGIDVSELDEIDELENVKDDDFDADREIDEIEPFVKRGQKWKLGNHYLLCGDSTSNVDVEKLMNGKQADLLLTDPPYNVAYEGEAGTIENDNMDSASFRNFLTDAFKNAYSVMNNGASFYVWYASREHVNFETALNDCELEVRQQLVWVKNALVLSRQDYHWRHEPCLYGWKGGASHNWYSDRKQSTVLEFDKPSRSELHPTMKPIDLIAYQVKNSSKKGDIVLDLFGGSGTTLIASEQLNRKCYLMELDERYASVIVKRWEDFTGQKAELIA